MELKKVDWNELRADVFNKHILDLSFNWLNDPEIQRMIDAVPVDREQQQKWFAELPFRSDYLIRSVWYRDTPIGVMGLKHITATDAKYWGYIGEREFWGKGIGGWMLQEAFRLAIERRLTRIYLQVLPTNIRAIRLYQKAGFQFLDTNVPLRLLQMERVILGDDFQPVDFMST